MFKTNRTVQIHNKMLESQKLNNKVLESQEISALADYRAFEERLLLVIKNHLYKNQVIDILSFKEKQMIYSRLCNIRPLQSATGCLIPSSQLNEINNEYHKIINEFRFKLEGKEISLVDFKILASFYDVLYHGIKKRKRRRFLKEAFAVSILEGFSLLKLVPKMYTACFSILINHLNDINKQNCSFEIRAKQAGLGIILTPVLNSNTVSIFSSNNKLDLLSRLKEEKKQYKTDYQEIYNFNNYNLNIHTMQEANYEEFLSYIKQGEDAKLTVNNSNREELALQSHSIWKLLQLLVINTLGLIVAQLAKMSYSLFFKLKNLFKQGENVDIKSSEQESTEYTPSKLLVPNNFNVTIEENSHLKKRAI
ncbi:hypothetical protein [Ancylomarina sp. 16SWW S1-10-2]|uniref:hypothetical protein n=1 Tax=Ancylomarina sp. 16SWW S1-10-2 TaxID=2499681 RepID=UPI0012AD5754|nr:hypothetical protein [Ancylomarina sp. 16SWW S1-10-2]MRT92767.1 hypothetical protein [Ancylomarina sp. 16SWW S1-10-2]